MFELLERYRVVLIYLPLIFYWIVLFTLTTLPTSSLPSVGLSDKLEHILAYFGLSFLLYLTLFFQKKSFFFKKNAALITLSIIILYGILDEVHQLLIPGRSCELYDFLADLLGGIIGIALVKIFTNYFTFQKSTTG